MVWAYFGVVALLAGVLCYMGAKSWPIWHVVVVFFVIMGLAGMMLLSAAALKTHQAWQAEYAQLEQQVESTQTAVGALRAANSLEPDTQAIASLPGVTRILSQTVIDRGRIWRNVSPTDVQPERISLDLTNWGDRPCARVGLPPDDDEPLEPVPAAGDDGGAAAAAAPATHQITAPMVVYAFQETPITELSDAEKTSLFGPDSSLVANDTEGACKLPTSYLGDYRVVEVNNNQVVVTPITPLGEYSQQALAQAPTASWTLYEVMPLDSHQVFAQVGGSTPNAVAEDEGGTSDPMDARREVLSELIPRDALPNMSQADYDKLIDQYARDQLPALPGDPPTETQTHVRFLRDHTIDVDLDEAETGAETSYDPSGRAQSPHLKHGGPVTYQQGDEQYFDTPTAERLIRDGVCERTDQPQLYARPLVDYVQFFQQNQTQLERLDNQIATLTADRASVLAAGEKVTSQIAYRTQERQKLQSDQSNYQRELSIVNELVAELKARREQQKRAIVQLYRSNQDLENQLRGNLQLGSAVRAHR